MIGSIVIDKSPVITAGKNVDRTLHSGQWQNYRHEIRSMGGYWSCGFSISGSVEELRDLMLHDLLAHVETFSADGTKAWEGFINGFVFNFSNMRVRFSLDGVANKVWARYLSAAGLEDVGVVAQDYDAEQVARLAPDMSGAGATTRTGTQSDTTSQARYGIREHVLSGGIMAVGVAVDLITNYLNSYAYPQPTIEFVNQNVDPRIATLEFECLGYWHTLYWRRFNQTSGGNENVSTQIDAAITAVGQFIASTDVETNTMQIPVDNDIDRKAADVILDVARLGDTSNNRYLVGVYDDRELIYEQQGDPTDSADYHRRLGDKTVYDKGQAPILDSSIMPGKWLRAEGVFPFSVDEYSDLRDDPSVVFIESVRYDESKGLELLGVRQTMIDQILARAAMANVSNL